MEYTDIVSPVDGVVVSRNVTMGQTVAASFQTPTLFLIATDLTKMEVDINVSKGDIGEIKEGEIATFMVDAFPKCVFSGTIRQVRQSPQTIQNVVTFDAVVAVNNADLTLKPGMTAAAKIIIDQRENIVRVPSQALRYSPQPERTRTRQPSLFVLRDGTPARITVKPGLDDGSFVEIKQGSIAPDDRVIVGENQTATRRMPPQPRMRF